MKAGEVLRTLNITRKTLNNYIHKGKVNPIVINSHHYEYDENEVFALIGKNKEKYNVTYSRVSQIKQKKDLESQTKRLYDFALSNGYPIKEQLEDVKSGMEFSKRKSFCKLLKLIMNHEVRYVIIENKDRLTRFGFELLKLLFRAYGCDIIVMSDTDNKSYEEELTDDLIAIIHYYSMKSYSNRRRLHKAQEALEEAR